MQAADLRPERGADRGALRQRGPGLVHPLRGRPGASGLHGGDAPRQSSGPPVISQPQPADARLAAVPGEGLDEKCVCKTYFFSPRHIAAKNVHPQVKYAKIYLRDTTLIPPFPMLLFGGDIDIQHRERLITLDGWIHFQVRGRWSFS